jgi:RNA polymerase sigma factor (sigma-70 family)
MPSDRSGTSAGIAALQLVLEEEQYRALSAEDLLGRYLTERDEMAFVALVRRYGRLVMARCRDILRLEDLSQEAFQETFTRLVLNGHNVRKRGAVGRWLARIARRQSLNIARRERRQRVRDVSRPVRATSPDASAFASELDTGRAVAHALSALPERLRLPIELVYLDGMTHAEAANALNWPKGTVDSYVRRGLARMRPVLIRAGVPAVGLGAVGLGLPAKAVPPDWVASAVAGATRLPIPLPPSRLALIVHRYLSPTGLAVASAAGITVAVGWTHCPKAVLAPVRLPPSLVVPAAVVESLPEQNLRLLRTDIGPKVCAALGPLGPADQAITLIEADAYDSRVKCVVEGCLQPRVPGAGTKSRLAFYFDTGTRRTHVYYDRAADGNWKSIDLEKPVILAKFPKLKLEWTMKVAELTAAVKAFDDIPRDPRAEAEVATRRAALRERLNDYAGKWFYDGDSKQVCRVEIVEPLGLTCWLPNRERPFFTLSEEQAWTCEAGSRALPINPDGVFGMLGLALTEDKQKLKVPPEGLLWWRVGRDYTK